MNAYDFAIYSIIFVSILTCFYLVISKFNNINHIDSENNIKNITSLKNNIQSLNNELLSIKQQLPTSSESSSESNFESNSSSFSNNIPANININTESNGPSNNGYKPPPVIFDPIANFDKAKLLDPLVDPRGRSSADQIPTPQVAMQFNFPTQGVIDRYHRVGLLIALDKDENKEENVSSEFIWNGPSKTSKKQRRPSISSENDFNVKPYKGVQSASSKSFEGFATIDGSDSDSYSDSEIEGFQNTTNIYNINGNAGENDILELIGRKITDNWYKYFTSISKGNKIIKIVVRNRNRKELYSGDIVFIPELGKSYRVKIDPLDQIEYNPYMF
jgi:hypothetical protein